MNTRFVDLDKVYTGGLYGLGPTFDFKSFQADAHTIEYSKITVFASDRLEVCLPDDKKSFTLTLVNTD